MRRFLNPQAESWRGFFPRLHISMTALGSVSISKTIVLLLLPPSLVAGAMLSAQASPASAGTAAPARKAVAAHKYSAETAPVAQPQPAPAPPAPKPPDWPANDLPSPANVVWDSHGLEVVASNSSLKQILKDISVDTGVKIEGLSQDERIFGTYGPGPAGDVISQLLDGSSYDVLIIGDLGQGTPRSVVLTARSSAASTGSNSNSNQPSREDTDAEEQARPFDEPRPDEPPYQQPPITPNGNASSVPARTQEQLIQEMQERQRQLEQQQQQNQQNPQ
jgi:hypothetical protein